MKSEANDWRGGTLNMMNLIWNLHDKPEGRSMSDVTFVLDDQTELQAHKLILATASPYFEALFYGPMANNKEPVHKIEVKDVQADVFRIIIQTIYNSGRYFKIKKQDDADKYIAIMEAADMYLLPNLVDIMANEVAECANDGAWDNLLPHLDRVSQLPLFAEIYINIKKWIIHNLLDDLGKRDPLWEKLCPRVQADVIEDLKKIAWEKDARECQMYIHLLGDIASTGAPFTELIDKLNVKLSPLVQSFENKESFIKAMKKIIKLKGDQQNLLLMNKKAEIHLELKTLLENKSWEELCQSAFGDVVNLLKNVIDHSNESKLKWEANVDTHSRYWGAPDRWYQYPLKSIEEGWKRHSDLLEFAHKYSLPELVDHCELLLMVALHGHNYDPEINALDYVIRTSGKKMFENMHKLGMFKVLSEFPKHISSPDWRKLTELEIMFFRDNCHHFKLATEDLVWEAIETWCDGTSKNASEARNKYDRIKSKRPRLN